MPRVKALGRYGEKDVEFARVVRARVKRLGKRPIDVTKRAGCSSSLYFKRLRDPEKLTVRELRAYILELKISEEDILDFLYDQNTERRRAHAVSD